MDCAEYFIVSFQWKSNNNKIMLNSKKETFKMSVHRIVVLNKNPFIIAQSNYWSQLLLLLLFEVCASNELTFSGDPRSQTQGTR